MRIAQVVHSFHPASGGIENHTRHLSNELARLDNEVEVYATSVPGARNREKDGNLSIRRFFSINSPFFTIVKFSPGMFFSLLSSNADIYASHGYGSLMPLLASIAAKIRGKPFVFTLHGYPRMKGKKRFLQSVYRYTIAPIFLGLASKIIVVSRESAEQMAKEADKRKIVVIPNGLDAGSFPFQPPKEGKALTYVGGINEYKGIGMLISAYARIRQSFPDAGLWLVGKDSGAKEELHRLANSLGVKIHFSEVPYEEMGKVYSGSAAIILPSKYEGFSLVWLEAMASGRPMFSTPVGDAPLLFEQAYGKDAEEFLFRDEDELVGKLTAYLKDPGRHRKTIERAEYIVKEEYSWENVARLTLNVYQDSLKR